MDLIKDELLKTTSVSYVIGVETKFSHHLSYCLARHDSTCTMVILSKALADKEQFLEEVMQLARIFNAVIIEEESASYQMKKIDLREWMIKMQSR